MTLTLAVGGLGWPVAAGADAPPLLALEYRALQAAPTGAALAGGQLTLRARQPARVVCHALAQPLRAGASQPMMHVDTTLAEGQAWHYLNGVNGWARWRALAPGPYDYVVTCAAASLQGGQTQRLQWRGSLQR
jgi:hypothetical protein